MEATQPMEPTPPPKTIWPCLNYADAKAAIQFLVAAFGFVETLVVEGDDPSIVEHAELRWPEGGGVMLGSAKAAGNEFERLPVGVASVYIVTDDPDGLYARATRAGAEIAREMKDEDYGSRGFTVRDPEGNLFSFGTYRGS